MLKWRGIGAVVAGVILMAGGLGPSHADTVDDLQYWAPVTFEVPIGKIKGALEVQPRLANDLGRLQTVQVKPSLSWDVRKNMTLTGGYFWAPNYPPVGQSNNNVTYEERVWQQVVVTHPLTPRRAKPVFLTHQAKLEQRFLPGVDPVAWRMRYLCRLTVPLGQSRWSWLLHDEIHVNLNAVPTVPGGLGQNRLFTGFRRQLSRSTAVEAGYLLQWVNQASGQPNQLNHAILTRLSMTMPNLRPSKRKKEAVTAPDEGNVTPLILD